MASAQLKPLPPQLQTPPTPSAPPSLPPPTRTPLQTSLCQQICLTLWKLRRTPHIEQQLFSSLNPQPRTLNPCQILAQSFQDPQAHHDLHLLDRYERATRSQFLRLMNAYRTLTNSRPT